MEDKVVRLVTSPPLSDRTIGRIRPGYYWIKRGDEWVVRQLDNSPYDIYGVVSVRLIGTDELFVLVDTESTRWEINIKDVGPEIMKPSTL